MKLYLSPKHWDMDIIGERSWNGETGNLPRGLTLHEDGKRVFFYV